MRFNITKLIHGTVLLVPFFLTSCGGGGGGGGAGSAPPVVYYDISGTITGLTGSGLVLQNNGGDNLSIASGSLSFTFPTPVANNAAYSVTVLSSPTSPSLTCTVNNPSGTVAGGNVTGVRVICSTSSWTIGGTVSGLTGSGLVLRNNSADDLPISGNGSFTFSTPVASGAQYNVTVKTHPNSPTQVCTVGTSIGIVTTANITNVSVVCDQIGRRFAYVTNSSDNTISIYAVNAATGQLQTYGIEPTGLTPLSVTVVTTDPSAQFAYVANSGDNTVSAYLIDIVAGTLTPIAGSPYAAGTAPLSVTIDTDGKFAYVANSSSGDVSAYTINTTTGELTAIDADTSTVGIDNFAAGTTPQSVSIDPSGLYAYVANSGSNDVSAYAIDAVTGGLTPIDADTSTVGIDNFAAGNSPLSVTIDPYGRLAYVANSGSDNVSAYTIDVSGDSGTPGALVAVNGSPFLAGNSPQSATIDPYGRFVYVANSVSNDVTAYAIVPSGSGRGALILVGSVAAGTTPQSVTVDPTGQFAYVANAGDNTVSAYTISGSTGGLTRIDANTGTTSTIDNFPAGSSPRSVTIDSAGKFAYVLNSGSVSAYTINSTTGALVAMTGSPYAAGSAPQTVAIDPTGKFAYVANSASNNVSAYTIDAMTSALIPVPGSPFAAGASPLSVTIHPLFPFAYVTYSGSGGFVSAYAIDTDGSSSTSSLGALTLVNTVTPGTAPQSVTIDPNGQFAYVAARVGASQNGSVSVYSIDSSTGALTQLAGSPYATGGFLPKAVTIASTPNGEFAYVVNANNSGSGTVAAYTITPGTGELTRITPNVYAGNNPQKVTIDPFGQFAYVANSDDGTVSAYTIEPTGALTRIDADSLVVGHDDFPAGSAPRSVTIDSTATYAYVANSGDGTISAYTIEAGGELTPIDTDTSTPSIENFAAGSNPQSVTIDITDTFAYVVNSGDGTIDGTISAYTIEPTGHLTPVLGSPFSTGTSPRLSIDPDLVSSKFVYVANAGSSNVSAYTINATTGVLTSVPGSPIPAGSGTSSIAITQ